MQCSCFLQDISHWLIFYLFLVKFHKICLKTDKILNMKKNIYLIPFDTNVLLGIHLFDWGQHATQVVCIWPMRKLTLLLKFDHIDLVSGKYVISVLTYCWKEAHKGKCQQGSWAWCNPNSVLHNLCSLLSGPVTTILLDSFNLF